MKTITLLFSLAIASSALAKNIEFQTLFNGKDLTGWKGEGYKVEDGAIVCTPKGKNLFTEATYANYVLELEFKLPPAGNNGLGIHYPGKGNGAYTGMEIQTLDNTGEKYQGKLKDYQWHGSLYELKPAKREGLKPVGEWNKQVVTINGKDVKVELNGVTILEADLDELNKTHPKHEGAKRRSGHIAFLGHGDPVAYRNIRIAEIAPPVAPAIKSDWKALFTDNSFKGWKHKEGITNWIAHNGIIKHNGQGGEIKDLWSEASYTDFTLVFDWRWSGRGKMKSQPVVQPDGSHKGKQEIEELDSGVYLRGEPKSQVNLWNWTVGSGEVYGYRMDKKMPPEVKAGVTPKMKADKPLGEWNHMEITMKGEVLNVTLNGQHVIVDAKLPGVPAEGPLALQSHGQAIDFANLYLKQLK
jgi:hypothetical protein